MLCRHCPTLPRATLDRFGDVARGSGGRTTLYGTSEYLAENVIERARLAANRSGPYGVLRFYGLEPKPDPTTIDLGRATALFTLGLISAGIAYVINYQIIQG